MSESTSVLFVQLLPVSTAIYTMYVVRILFFILLMFPPMNVVGQRVCMRLILFVFLLFFFFFDMLVSKWIPWKYLFRSFAHSFELNAHRAEQQQQQQQICQRREKPKAKSRHTLHTHTRTERTNEQTGESENKRKKKEKKKKKRKKNTNITHKEKT